MEFKTRLYERPDAPTFFLKPQKTRGFPGARKIGPFIDLEQYDTLVKKVQAATNKSRTLVAQGVVRSSHNEDPTARAHHNLHLFTIHTEGPYGTVRTHQGRVTSNGFRQPMEKTEGYGIWMINTEETGLLVNLNINFNHRKAEHHEEAAIVLHREILHGIQNEQINPAASRESTEQQIKDIIKRKNLPFLIPQT